MLPRSKNRKDISEHCPFQKGKYQIKVLLNNKVIKSGKNEGVTI